MLASLGAAPSATEFSGSRLAFDRAIEGASEWSRGLKCSILFGAPGMVTQQDAHALDEVFDVVMAGEGHTSDADCKPLAAGLICRDGMSLLVGGRHQFNLRSVHSHDQQAERQLDLAFSGGMYDP